MVKSVLAEKTFAYRGDYTGFIKGALLLLTRDTENYRYSPTGAIHKARFMAKCVCSNNLVLLRDEIFAELKPEQVMTAAQAILIERFAKFICLPYIKWWVRCALVCESGLVDLEFFKDIRA